MKKKILFMFLVLAIGCTKAQTWKNLVYNQYQYGLEHNPLKGYASMWKVHTSDPNDPNYIPFDIQGNLFEFNAILTGYNSDSNAYVYDWSIVDNFIQEQESAGKHVFMQVIIDPVKNDQTLYLPQFIKNELLATDPITGQSNLLYPTSTSVVLNWNHPAIMNAILDFVEKFGARYNNKDVVFLVGMGLYGMWGEWHTGTPGSAFPQWDMNEANRNALANKFEQSFPNKQVLGRYPESFNNPSRFGFSDGLFFEHSIGVPHWYFQNILNADGAANAWQQHPIGGEASPDIQPYLFQNYPNTLNVSGDSVFVTEKNKKYAFQRIDSTLAKLHTTWIFANYMFQNPNQTGFNTTMRNNAKRNAEFMGYRFVARNYRTTAINGFPTLELRLQNTGVAPMYANWDVEMAAINASGNLISLKTQKWNLNEILPSTGTVTTTKSITSNTALPNGTYTILIRVINPLSALSNGKAAPFRFANKTQDMHRVGWLTVAQITITNGIVTASSEPIVQTPFGGINRTIPGIIEGEEYDNGGSAVAFGDNSSKAGITTFRPGDNVDVFRKNTASNNFVVGQTVNGEWLEYTINVQESRLYKIKFNYFRGGTNAGPSLKLILDGVDLTTISGMQSFSNWETRGTITLENVFIQQGQNKVLRLLIQGGNFDIDNLIFEIQPIINDGIYAIQSVSGAYINADPGTSNVVSSTSLAGNASKWNITKIGDDIYTIQAVGQNNHKLEVPWGICDPFDVKTSGHQGPENHLKWKAYSVNGKIMFSPLHCTAQALDAEISNPSKVWVDVKNPNNNDQLFTLIPQSSPISMVLGTEESISEPEEEIVVYPNPANDYLNVYVPQASTLNTSLEFFDIQGRIISVMNNIETNTKFDLTDIDVDIIFVRIINSEGIKVFKIVHNK